ncbi:Calcium-binding protein krp1 [Asimina triloba]
MAESGSHFLDFLPSMAEKLGVERFMDELCNGFQLLMDGRTGLITFESLKRNAARGGFSSRRIFFSPAIDHCYSQVTG